MYRNRNPEINQRLEGELLSEETRRYLREVEDMETTLEFHEARRRHVGDPRVEPEPRRNIQEGLADRSFPNGQEEPATDVRPGITRTTEDEEQMRTLLDRVRDVWDPEIVREGVQTVRQQLQEDRNLHTLLDRAL